MMHWVNRYIGIPFSESGLTRAGLHCWGLCRLVLSEQCWLELPSYAEQSAADLLAAARFFKGDSERPPWRKVEGTVRPFDVVLMSAMSEGPRPRAIAGHCGIAVDATRLLHIWHETDSVQMNFDHPRIRHRLLGVYRHQALA